MTHSHEHLSQERLPVPLKYQFQFVPSLRLNGLLVQLLDYTHQARLEGDMPICTEPGVLRVPDEDEKQNIIENTNNSFRKLRNKSQPLVGDEPMIRETPDSESVEIGFRIAHSEDVKTIMGRLSLQYANMNSLAVGFTLPKSHLSPEFSHAAREIGEFFREGKRSASHSYLLESEHYVSHARLVERND
jgi:hypothetical protein